jgi:hypothetical protein
MVKELSRVKHAINPIYVPFVKCLTVASKEMGFAFELKKLTEGRINIV